MKKLLTLILCGAISLIASSVVNAQTLEKIKQRGLITVGVKNDYPPFGFLDPSGQIVGVEPDLAADIASKLGVKLELVPVQTANRIEFLQQGRIDLMIASMSDNAQRRAAVGVIETPYRVGGTAILVAKDAHIGKWEDLRGKKVCGIQGAYYNRPVAEKFGADIVAFAGMTEAQSALLAGACVGLLQDDALLAAVLSSNPTKWSNYALPLPIEDPKPVVVAVPLAERDGEFGRFVDGVIKDWHRTGKIIALHEKWKLPPSDFLQEMKTKYSN